MRTPQRSSRLANPCTPLTEVQNAGLLYAAYHKGGSFQARRTVRCKPCTRLLLTFTLFSIISFLWENTSGFGWGYFSCKYGLESNRKYGIIDVQFLQRLLRIKPQGSFFIFSRIQKWQYGSTINRTATKEGECR